MEDQFFLERRPSCVPVAGWDAGLVAASVCDYKHKYGSRGIAQENGVCLHRWDFCSTEKPGKQPAALPDWVCVFPAFVYNSIIIPAVARRMI